MRCSIFSFSLTKGHKITISMLLELSVSSLAFNEISLNFHSFEIEESMKPLSVMSNMIISCE